MVQNGITKVLVVDAEPVSRCGLIHLIQSHPRLEVVAEADNIPLARELCARHRPDLLVLDTALGDGVGFIKELPRWCAQARVVVFTSQADALSVQRAFQAGTCAYVTRRDTVATLVAALENAAEGRRTIGPRAGHLLLERMACGGLECRGGDEVMLSDRELQVFRLIGQGLGTRAVAGELQVSIKTVETHRQRIKEKLKVTSGSELQRRAILFQGVTPGTAA